MTSPTAEKVMYSATKVSSEGNIWIKRRKSRPGRRPMKRIREKA